MPNSASGTLVDWVVEIDASQVLGLKEGISDASKSMSNAALVAKALKDVIAQGEKERKAAIEATTKAMADQKEKSQAMQTALGIAYAHTAGAILQWVRAGIQGTAEGERLSMMMQMLSRQIANIFAPAIRWVIDRITALTQWFGSLSGEGQRLISAWAGMTAGVVAFGAILIKLAPALEAVRVGLAAAFNAYPIFAIIGVIAALLTATEGGRNALGAMFNAVMPIVEKFGELLGQIFEAFEPAIDAFGNALASIAPIVGDILRAFAPVLEIVAEVANLLASTIAPVITVIAELVRGLLVPAFELLRPILELLSDVLKGIANSVRALAAWLGIQSAESRGRERRAERPRDELSNRGGAFESFAATWERIQNAVNRTDVAQRTREQHLRVSERIEMNTRPRARQVLVTE